MSNVCNKTVNQHMMLRVDTKLKSDFEAFCNSCEMTVSTAINLLIQETLFTGKIPFQIKVPKSQIADEQGGPLQEVRMSVRMEKKTREQFKEICNNMGLPMSRITKMYMANCVQNGYIPF